MNIWFRNKVSLLFCSVSLIPCRLNESLMRFLSFSTPVITWGASGAPESQTVSHSLKFLEIVWRCALKMLLYWLFYADVLSQRTEVSFTCWILSEGAGCHKNCCSSYRGHVYQITSADPFISLLHMFYCNSPFLYFSFSLSSHLIYLLVFRAFPQVWSELQTLLLPLKLSIGEWRVEDWKESWAQSASL